MRVIPLWEVFHDVSKELKTRTGKPKYPTGFDKLDKTLWGLHKKEILTLGARPSQGKSSFAMALAYQVAEKGAKVLYVSLEMTKEQLAERLYSREVAIPGTELRKGYFKDDETLLAFEKKLSETSLLIVDDNCRNVQNLESILKDNKFDFVFFDYIQLIHTGKKSKLEGIEDAVCSLKAYSIQYDFGLVLVSQINRDGNETPSMSTLKGAGILEEHSDTVVLLKYVNSEDKCFKESNFEVLVV